MSKNKKDIKSHILNEANNLFKEYEYDEVDMRGIAKNSKVAVGTLYNYFKGKEDLYISILKESWEETYKKIDKIPELDLEPIEKVYLFFDKLQEDKEKRNHLSKKIIHRILDDKKKCSSHKFFKQWITYLDSKLSIILKSADKKSYFNEDEYNLLSHTLIGAFFSMNQNDRDSKAREEFFKKYLYKIIN